MFKRFFSGFAAALVAVAVSFGGSAIADDKDHKKGDQGQAAKQMDCGYCKAVENVCSNMRCDGCKDQEAQCQHCKDMAMKCKEMAMCSMCMDMSKKNEGMAKPVAACADCTKNMTAMKDKGHCEFCSQKKMVADHAACCKSCKEKGAKATEACAKCQDMKKMMMAAKCPHCEGKMKKQS